MFLVIWSLSEIHIFNFAYLSSGHCAFTWARMWVSVAIFGNQKGSVNKRSLGNTVIAHTIIFKYTDFIAFHSLLLRTFSPNTLLNISHFHLTPVRKFTFCGMLLWLSTNYYKETVHTTTESNIPEGLNLQRTCCDDLRSRNSYLVSLSLSLSLSSCDVPNASILALFRLLFITLILAYYLTTYLHPFYLHWPFPLHRYFQPYYRSYIGT